MKRIVSLLLGLIVILALLCSCSNKPKELRNIEIISISVVLNYDESEQSRSTGSYKLDINRAGYGSIKDSCIFTYNLSEDESRDVEWTTDTDGTKHMHVKYKTNGSVEYDISVYEKVLGLIENADPSIYTGPGSDSNGKIVRKVLPYLITLVGIDKSGDPTIVYIDKIATESKLLDLLNSLRETN